MPIDDEEPRISFLKRELEASLLRINSLEKENQELKQELARLRSQVITLKAHDSERKSMLWKKIQNSMDDRIKEVHQQKPQTIPFEKPAQSQAYEKAYTKEEKPARVPQPPPKPRPAEPPLPKSGPSPPPPPPPPAKLLGGSKAVRRVPEVMEFYRSLMKRETQKDSRTSAVGVMPVINPRNMIGEIENRSSYVLGIKSDVETHGEYISFLTREVENAAFADVSEVESFVKWLDGELSCLVDERAVLKHFPKWPERKADALREVACSYRDLKSLESEVSSFKDNPKQQLSQSLTKMQALQDRLEQHVSNIERVRDGTIKRYREFHIPWEWMMDTGMIGKLKLTALTLAKVYMTRITKELQYSEPLQGDDLLLQGVRFVYRIHQFAGGFDTDTVHAFEELRKTGTRFYKQ